MDNIQEFAPEIQKRISDFEHFLGKMGMKRHRGQRQLSHLSHPVTERYFR